MAYPANLTHYITAALIQQAKLVVAGHLSSTGNTQPVSVFRETPTVDPMPPPPHVWFESQGATVPDDLRVLGNTVGQDSQGNQRYGAILWAPVSFGVRCRLPAERDDLFDLLFRAFDGQGINAATGNRWVLDIYSAVGVLVTEVKKPTFVNPPIETTAQGALFEAMTDLTITSVAAESVSQAIVQTIDINPVTIDIAIPLN